MKVRWNSFDEAMDGLAKIGKLALYVVLTMISFHVWHRTLPKLDGEIDQAQHFSVESALTAMSTRKVADYAQKQLPAEIAKVNAVIDNVAAMAQSGKGLVDATTKNENAVSGQLVTTIKTANGTLASARDLIDAAKKPVEGLQTTEAALTDEINELHTATAGISRITNDPALHATAQNVQRGSGALADIAVETRAKVHSIYHPKWPSVVGNWVERIGVDVGKVLF